MSLKPEQYPRADFWNQLHSWIRRVLSFVFQRFDFYPFFATTHSHAKLALNLHFSPSFYYNSRSITVYCVILCRTSSTYYSNTSVVSSVASLVYSAHLEFRYEIRWKMQVFIAQTRWICRLRSIVRLRFDGSQKSIDSYFISSPLLIICLQLLLVEISKMVKDDLFV